MSHSRLFRRFGAACVSLLLLAACVPAQSDLDRGVQDLSLYRSRARSKQRSKRPTARYQRRGAGLPAQARVAAGSEIGVTIWQLRPSALEDPEAAREIIHRRRAGEPASWTPERVGTGRSLRVGQRFRIGIETPRDGYLYVANRSVYADGTPRAAHLIFPTRALHGGENRVSAGRLIEIPARGDDPPYFEIAGDASLRAEELVVIVTPKPLDLRVGEEPVALAEGQLDEWERAWGAPHETLEIVGGEGMIASVAERSAAAERRRLLTREDPLPQTVYRIASKREGALFLRIAIPVAQSSGESARVDTVGLQRRGAAHAAAEP